jgi:hypothetical protein
MQRAALIALWLIMLGALLLAAGLAQAHDPDHEEFGGWYMSLIQPDNAPAPCCGEADAYWADEIHVRDGKTYATITDDRPDEPRKRPHFDVGTTFEVPDSKLKWDAGNPTGHAIIFLSRGGHVYCFVQGTGG